MEFVTAKRTRNRKRKRHVKKHRREQVRLTKRQKLVADRGNVFIAKEKVISSTMQANAFWENYSAAQEWQNRHSIVWWKSRCSALEYENQILRDKIRLIAGHSQVPQSWRQKDRNKNDAYNDNDYDKGNDVEEEEGEDLEFQVDEDMLSFLEQSIKHKQELKKRREKESGVGTDEENEEDKLPFESSAELVRARNTGAKLLYGDSSSKILAMETALEATVERHKERAKPQYWPHIPLKP